MNAMPFNVTVFLDRLNNCVARYSGNNLDVDALRELRALRHEMAQALLAYNPLDLDERLYAGPVGTAHRLLKNCGLRDAPLTADERLFVDNIVHELVLAMDQQGMRIRNLVSTCLLYRDAYQVSLKPKHLRMPQQLVWTLLSYIFSYPWAFRRQEDVEHYYSYVSDMLHWLHDMLLDASNSAEEVARLVSDIATPLASIFSFSPLYFSDHNLKDECTWRAGIMEFVCQFTYGNTYRYRDLSVDHVFQPCSGREKSRIGILMPQFKSASETFATLPVFEHLDRERFEIILYTLKANGGPLERYCASRADRLTDITTRIDQQLRIIRGDDLDILFIGTNIMADRSAIGWLALHRLARIQVTSICSPMTTGMRNMGGYIAGNLALPTDDPQRDYTERLITVPGSGICFSYGPPEPPGAPALERKQVGIPEQATAYICGSNFFKLLPKVRDLYARIIASVPGSVLVMYPFNPNWIDTYPASVMKAFTDDMKTEFARHGVAQERLIVLQPRENFAEIRAILRQADVYLDSFPYSGATSIADALQAQLPPVVMDGRYLRFRQAAAMLRGMDLPGLVATDESEYLNLAVKLGSDRDFRAQLVARLRANLDKPGNFLDSRTFSQQMARVFEELLAEYRVDDSRRVSCPCGSGQPYKLCCAQRDKTTLSVPDVPKSLRSALDHHKALQSALDHHKAGRLAEARTLCKQVLQAKPTQHKAPHLLGLIANQTGENERAAELMNRATRPALAVTDIPKVIQSALDHHRAGRLSQAKTIYQRVLHVAPDHDTALHLLGLIANQEKEYDKAVELMSRSIQASPGNAVYYYNLGAVYNARNEPDEAIACYRKALALKPDDAEILNNLGNSLKERGKSDEAIACYRKSLALKPDDATTLNNLGIALKNQDRFDEAIACYQKALALKPDETTTLINLAVALKKQGRLDEAIACYKQVVALRPSDAEAHKYLGTLFTAQGRLDDALTCYRQALTLRPDDAEALNYAGFTLKDQGKTAEAVSCYQRAIAISPEYAVAHSNKLLTAYYATIYPPDALFAEHLKFLEQFETPLKASWRPHGNSHDPGRRLKVGYVSPDFCSHAVAYFIEPILTHHDKSQVEIFCYYTLDQQDSVTRRLKASADHWLQCADMTDDQLAERIRADGIDILVDLAGHTGGNRLLVFARKPAPVQVTYLGYIHTTGLSAIDYRLTHIDADPPDSQRYYSETLYRLPGSFWWCYRPRPDMPDVAPLPALANGYVTFGSTNNFAKLSPETQAAWAQILQAAPQTRLLIAGVPEGSARQTLIDRFTAQGIDAHRLLIHGRLPAAEFWRLHQEIDILLDSFPHNGGTTTCDALWLGVPVVALTGQVLVSRMGYALLKNLDLPELAAETVPDYVNIAVGLAGDPERLKTLRAGMRARLAASPLRDEAGFTRHLETAYREMWRRWCSGTT